MTTSACPACGCNPADLTTLGRHGGAACINPACPADCHEPLRDRLERLSKRDQRLCLFCGKRFWWTWLANWHERRTHW